MEKDFTGVLTRDGLKICVGHMVETIQGTVFEVIKLEHPTGVKFALHDGTRPYDLEEWMTPNLWLVKDDDKRVLKLKEKASKRYTLIEKFSKYGDVKTCKLVSEKVATIVITKGFSENAKKTFEFLNECNEAFPDHTILETVITETDFAMVVLVAP